mmetsp:Transcript_99723/g.286441  ORF Transcript_99723/g.286441 Transcript_99723/m.286441 type:complete len:91 (-) Transcript_99723:546-818(-)
MVGNDCFIVTATIPVRIVPIRNCMTRASENGLAGGGDDDDVTDTVADSFTLTLVLVSTSALSDVPVSVADDTAINFRIPTTDPAVESRVK